MLRKGKSNTESCCRHKDFEISIARDERSVVIKAGLSDESISKIRSSAASERFGPKQSGSFPKAFRNLKGGKLKDCLS